MSELQPRPDWHPDVIENLRKRGITEEDMQAMERGEHVHKNGSVWSLGPGDVKREYEVGDD